MTENFYSNPIQPDLIHLRDPFILEHNGTYYLYGTTRDVWGKESDGFDAWYGKDLVNWSYGGQIYKRADNAVWNRYNFWAPEVYYRNGRFYMFYAAKSDNTKRALGVAISENPLGPFIDGPNNPLTPADWDCLDAHLYTDADGRNYLFFVHEWVQTGDGEMWIQPLADDLTSLTGERILLFKASEASWNDDPKYRVVIDGPSLIVHSGKYYLMWSSFLKNYTYSTGYAVSSSLMGPYTHCGQPIIKGDGGHNSWFVGPDGSSLYACYHSPNKWPDERLCIDKLHFDENGMLGVDESRGIVKAIGLPDKPLSY